MKYNTFTSIVLLVATSLFGASSKAEEPTPKEVCSIAKEKYFQFRELKKVDIDQREEEMQHNIRPCVQTYPWPEGKFLTDNGDKIAVTSDEMLKIKKDIERLVRMYDHLDLEEYLSKTDSFQDRVVAYRLSEGMDRELLSLYGEFLYLHTLIRDEKYQEAYSYAENYVSRQNIKPKETTYDALEETTYFSKQSLHNLIILNKFLALAASAEGTLEDQAKYLHEYSLIREKLKVQASSFGDPYDDLFYNVGCDTLTHK